jgi:putative tricarboxylic transport membrane protein
VSSDERIPGVDAPTLREAGVDMALQNWRMVAAAPGITAITADIEKMVNSATWQATLETKGWVNTYLAGEEFATQLAADTAATEAILKDIGLVQ